MNQGYSAYGQQPQQQNAWGAPQQQQNPTGFSSFNQPNRSVSQTPGYGQQPQAQGADAFKPFYSTGDFEQTLTSYGANFTFQDEKDTAGNSRHQNIRVMPKFVNVSSQMLRVLDMQAMQKQGPQPNYENLAGTEYQNNKMNYVHNAKASGQPQQQPQIQSFGQMGMQPQQTQGGWPSSGGMGQNSSFQQKPLFGQTAGFGQTQQPQQTSFLSGQQQQPQTQAPLFGAQANASPFGAKPAFGNAPTFGTQQPAFGQQSTTPAFGQQPQQNTLFGAKPTTPAFGQPQTQSAGMFGQQATSTPFGAFGQQQQPQAQGLFGQQNTPQPTMALGASGQNTGLGLTMGAPQGSLFGAKPAAAAGSSLFGQAAPAGSGMFGAQPASAGTGLFGAQPAAGQQPSLFGAKPLGQAPGGSLFGGQQAQPGGAFGLGSGQGSLFGNMAQPQQQQANGSFGLLGQQQQQQQNQMAAPIQVYNPYGDVKSDPYGGASNYISSVSPLADAEKELKRIQEEIFKSSSSTVLPFKDSTAQDLSRLVIPGGETTGYLDQYEPLPQVLPTAEEKLYSQHDKLSEKYKNAFQNDSVSGQYKSVKVYNAMGASFKQAPPKIFGGYDQPTLRNQKSFGTDTSLQLSRQSSLRSNAQNVNLDNHPEEERTHSVKSTNPDVLQIRCQVPATKDSLGVEIPSSVFALQIHKSRHMKDIYDKLNKYLKDTQKYGDLEDFKLVHRGQILSSSNSLTQAGIKEGVNLDVILQMKVNPENLVSQSFANNNAPPSQALPANKVGLENTLKAPKQGYQTSPSFDQLKRYSEQELKRVKDFKIWNEYGQIFFKGETDLTEQDLSEIVTIGDKAIEVYPDKMKEQNKYPCQGDKLNRPAELTFRKMEVKGATLTQKVEKLTKIAESIGFKHVSFNEKSGDWITAVGHFTKYTFNLDEDEEEAESFQASHKMVIPEEDSQMSEYSLQEEIAARKGAQYQPPRPQYFGAAPNLIPNAQSTTFNQFQQLSTLQGLPIPRRRQDHQNESEVHSSVIRGAYGENEPMIDLIGGERFTPQIGLAQSQMLSQSQFKAQEVLMRIAKRDKEIANVSTLYTKKQSVAECLAYLKTKQGVNVKQVEKKDVGFKKTPMTAPRFRPQFRPDGTLLTLKRSTNKLLIVEVKVVKDSTNTEQKKVYHDLTDVLKKHTTFSHVSQDEVAHGMGNMTINNGVQDQILGRRSFSNFEDKSIQDMLTRSKLPCAQIKQSPGDMFRLYEALAINLVTKLALNGLSPMTREKLSQEFYIICLLNALYGNPNIHLVQKHPAFKQGPNNYEKARKSYAESFAFGSSLENEKKRKNALTEVLRFICHQEYPIVQAPAQLKDDGIYHRALAYLMNGDIKGAVSLLNKCDKKQMALRVVSCFNNPLYQQSMREEAKKLKHFTEGAKSMVDYIIGQYKSPYQTWMQALLYHLMVKSVPTSTLQEVINEFYDQMYSKQQPQPQEQPLAWVLIKFFAMSQKDQTLINSLQTFQGISIYPKQKHPIDRRLSFLVSLSLSQALTHHENNMHHYNNQFQSMSICHSSLTKVTLRYIGQLLREGDWQQALLVSSYIPPSFTKTRKQVVYAIMMRNGAKLFKELGSESQSMLLKVIKVPREYFFSSRAVMHESLGNYECAMQDYHWSGNDNMAHKIFMKHIAPLYFTNPDDMSHLIQCSKTYNPALYDMLCTFEDKSQNIVGWTSQGAVIKDFIRSLFIVKGGVDNLYKQWPSSFDSHLQSISTRLLTGEVDKSHPAYMVQRFIWENLLNGKVTSGIEQVETAMKAGNPVDAAQLLDEIRSVIGQYQPSPQLARRYQELAQTFDTLEYCARPHVVGERMEE